jgi:uncharacterized protein with FMN-binding domain
MRRIMMGVLCAVLSLAAVGCGSLKRMEQITIQDVDLAAVKDGTYMAAQDFTLVTAEARVTVKGGRMTEVVLLKHSHGPNHGADAILPRVLDRQSLLVDAVSGSTYSSKVVLKAIEEALRKGL